MAEKTIYELLFCLSASKTEQQLTFPLWKKNNNLLLNFSRKSSIDICPLKEKKTGHCTLQKEQLVTIALDRRKLKPLCFDRKKNIWLLHFDSKSQDCCKFTEKKNVCYTLTEKIPMTANCCTLTERKKRLLYFGRKK